MPRALQVTPAQGSEDTGIPLDIRAAPTDLSEVVSVTISGVPVDAVLSAGTHNPDGTWTLTSSQLCRFENNPAGQFGQRLHSHDHRDVEGWGAAPASVSQTLVVTVDPVSDAPTLAVAPAAGGEDTAIPLNIQVVLSDASEILSVTIAGVPTGAFLSAGTQNPDGIWTLSAAQLTGLTVTPPANSDLDFSLSVTATSRDGSAAPASVTTALPVTVDPVSDMPTLSVISTRGFEDTAIPIDIRAALTDTSEVLSVTIAGVPTGGALSSGIHNADGTWTLTAPQLIGLKVTPAANSDEDFTLSVTATSKDGAAQPASVTRTLIVTVDPVSDAPALLVTPASGAEDTAISLDVRAAVTDASEVLSVTVSGVPTGAILSAGAQNADGTWTLTPAQLPGLTIRPPSNSDADFTLTVMAKSIDGAALPAFTMASLPVTVSGVADQPNLSASNVNAVIPRPVILGGNAGQVIAGTNAAEEILRRRRQRHHPWQWRYRNCQRRVDDICAADRYGRFRNLEVGRIRRAERRHSLCGEQ